VNYADGRADCQAAVTGGFDDWRLPSVLEYATLWSTELVPDYRLWTVEGQIPYQVWTGTGALNSTYILVLTIPYRYGVSEQLDPGPHIQCVRTAQVMVQGTPAQRFSVDPANNTVFDRYTNLTWQRTADESQRSFDAAMSYCSSLGLGYRLPTFAELISLSDQVTRRMSAEFIGPPSAYWTSSQHRTAPSHIYVFDAGLYWYYGNTGDGTPDPAAQAVPEFRARCVHEGPP